MVFSMAPAPEWPQVVTDNPATAPVDIACGIVPLPRRPATLGRIAWRGRPPVRRSWRPPTSRSCSTGRARWRRSFRNLIIAAEPS